jgi:hypothetical protein
MGERFGNLCFFNGNNFFVNLYGSFIDFRYFAERNLDFSIYLLKSFLVKDELVTETLFIFDEELGNDLIHFGTCYPIKVFLVDLFYEFHHFFGVSESSNINFEL